MHGMNALQIPPPPPPVPTFEQMTFGQRIRYARECRNMSGLALCKALDVPSQTLSTWERGTMPTKPDAFTLCDMLQEVLGYYRDWFAWGIVPPELPDRSERDNAL
jgi:transcriptional regulator with XRE-family HTH domain